MGVVGVLPPGGDVGESVDGFTVESDERVQGARVAEDRAAAVDGQVAEPDRRPAAVARPCQAEGLVQGRRSSPRAVGAFADVLDGLEAGPDVLVALGLSVGVARHGQGGGADEEAALGCADAVDAGPYPGGEVAAQAAGVVQR
ncbi:hypothetical protein [Kitasatospora sp. MBT63]|uniref:hypothetical protein n=1 Tax=Kitasatospora sp. MBT63 TaxID=1444768 RepID=UPI00053B1D41|nr:hypothetical protein [Kitasatospora sp. MBT63]